MEDVIYNYIIKQLSEVPMILNRKLSYKNIKFNSKNEFDKLRLMIDSFLDGESEERYVICYISHAKQQISQVKQISKK